MLLLYTVKMLCEKVVLVENMALVNYYYYYFFVENLATMWPRLASNLHQSQPPES